MGWRYVGSLRDALSLTQRAVDVFGPDLVRVLRALDGDGFGAAVGALRELAAKRTAAAESAAMEGAATDDAEAMLAAMDAVQKIAPADVVEGMVERLRSPAVLSLLVDAAALCEVDGERYDPDAPSEHTLAQIVAGVLSALRAQAVFH